MGAEQIGVAQHIQRRDEGKEQNQDAGEEEKGTEPHPPPLPGAERGGG